MHVESRSSDVTRQILVDFGHMPLTLNNNMEILGINPAALDALVVSHGHYDHFGGLIGFLDASKGRLEPGITLLVVGEPLLRFPAVVSGRFFLSELTSGRPGCVSERSNSQNPSRLAKGPVHRWLWLPSQQRVLPFHVG